MMRLKQLLVRSFLFALPASLAVLLLAGRSREKEKMNVLFILVDDLRPELGCYGVTAASTPHIDGLAKEAMLFTKAYCQFSWCSPSRTSLLTGLRPDHTKVYDLQTHFRNTIPQVVTLPQLFKNNGYRTLAFGKVYHNDPALQDSLSWDRPCWFPAGSDPIYAYADKDNIDITARTGKPFANAVESADVPDNAYPDGQVADKVISELDQLAGKPFFLAVGFYKPHLPYTAPKKYFDRFDAQKFIIPSRETPQNAPAFSLRARSEEANYIGVGSPPFSDSLTRALTHGYYACTAYVDAQIGRILEKLKQLKLDKNTIVVFWGDHGYKLGEYGHWSKHSNFEVDTRVPLIIRDPRRKARTVNEVVETIDIYPTLCKMAGLPVSKNVDGKSLIASNNGFAISQIQRNNLMGYSIRTERYRYTQWLNMKTRVMESEELYDHREGLLETENISNNPDLLKEKAKLHAMLQPYINF